MSEITYNYGEIYGHEQRHQGGVLGTTALLAMIACIINCALPQVEMLLTGGRCPVPIAAIKIASFGLLVVLTLTYGRLDLSAFPTGMWLIVITFLFLDFPFLWFWQGKAPAEIMLAYNAYYCPVIFAPLACAFTGRLSQRLATQIVVGIFLVCAVVGWAQFIFQTPIVQLASSDGNFRIYASYWMQEGSSMVRAFSIFGSALEYGHIAVLAAAIGIGMCGRPGGWIKGVPLYLLAAACCFTTMTRVVYLQLIFATIAALTFTFGRSLRRMIWQPVVGFILSSFIAFGGVAELIGQRKTLYDASSLQLRLLQWEIYGVELLHSTFAQKLFGLGLCQADKPVIVPTRDQLVGKATVTMVDNMYLALTLHVGLIGTVLIVALFWAMWRHLRAETIKQPTPLLIGIASFWSTFLMTGMFNLQQSIYGFWFLIAIMILQRENEAELQPDWIQDPVPALE